MTLALAVTLLSACAVGPTTTGPSADSPSPSSPTAVAELDYELLTDEDVAFDPAVDVPGTEVCDGLAGREELEQFDRAGWSEFGIADGVAIMTCGNAEGAGWRHIADGHVGDFGELADYFGVGWEDVAWWSIQQALADPDEVEMYRDDIANYLIEIELYDTETDELVTSWEVTVGVGLSTWNVITAFPDEQ